MPTIPSFDSSYKVPKYVALLVFGAGAVTSAASAMVSINVGMKVAAGSLTPDVDIVQIFSITDADTGAGAGSELAQMDYAALAQGTPALYHAAVLENAAGVQSTATVALAGAPTVTGQWVVSAGGQTLTGGIGLSDTPTTIGTAITAAVTNTPRFPLSASGTATVTFTVKNKGIQGNDWILYFDPTNFTTTGLTATVTGSAMVNSNPYRVRMGVVAGTLVPNVTNITNAMFPGWYHRIAFAQYDTGTNATIIQAYIDSKSAPFVQRYEQALIGFNGTLGAATTLAKTTLNDVNISVLWSRNSEWHPAMMAAAVSAARASVEGSNPLFDWDNWTIPGMPGQRFNADYPLDTENNTALGSGVTPLSTANNKSVIVRGITSHCLSGALADYRTIDWGDPTVMQRFVIELGAVWTTSFRIKNQVVTDNPPSGSDGTTGPHIPPGVGYPQLWDTVQRRVAKNFFDRGWIQPFQQSDISSFFDAVNGRIMSEDTITPLRLQHQIGVIALDGKNA